MNRLSEKILIAALVFGIFAPSCGPPGELDLDPAAKREQAIISGTPAAETFIPAAGALVINHPWFFQSYCSGTLIASNMVLTAAHCITEMPSGYPLGFFYGASTKNPLEYSKTIAVASTHYHPSYNHSATPPSTLSDYYDIAVVKLAQASTITPMKMVRPSEASSLLKIGGPVLIVGYGKTDAQDSNSSGIKYQGQSTIGQVGSSEIWIVGQGYSQKCQGDSGGPTLANLGTAASPDWRVIGVASRAAVDCTWGSVETRVDSYLSWIHTLGTIPCGSGLSASCTPPPPKKKLGETCKANEDCQSKLCITYDGQAFCSQLCSLTAKDCPSGYTCTPISGSTKGACTKEKVTPPPPKKKLGEACSKSQDCASGMCAAMGNQTFCTKPCTTDTDCGSASLSCAPAGAGQSLCAPVPPVDPAQASSGGCSLAGAAGSGRGRSPGPGPAPFALVSLLLLLAAGRRRR